MEEVGTEEAPKVAWKVDNAMDIDVGEGPTGGENDDIISIGDDSDDDDQNEVNAPAQENKEDADEAMKVEDNKDEVKESEQGVKEESDDVAEVKDEK